MALENKPSEDCEAFVQVHGEVTCSPDKVTDLVKAASNKLVQLFLL